MYTDIDFPFLLLFLCLASGSIWLVDYLMFAKQRVKTTEKLPLLVDYAKTLFPVFIIVFILRTFLAQLFVIPTGSLEPTVVPGDFVFVTQYSYGLHLPIWNKTLLNTSKPKIGDIVVFHWPTNTRVDLIKRVIGVPGDKVSYINKVFYINGKKIPQKFISSTMYGDAGLVKWKVNKLQENLFGVKHNIYLCPSNSSLCPNHITQNFYNLTIPKGEYLLIGDNRDDSDDSRFWGFVPAKDLLGKAHMIVFSWDSSADIFHKVRWKRIGIKI